MKNTRESFEENLRERLRTYKEVPTRDLWKGIAEHIVSVAPESQWAIWFRRLAVVAFVLTATREPQADKDATIAALEAIPPAGDVSGKDRGGVVVLPSTGEVTVERIRSGEDHIAIRVVGSNDPQPANHHVPSPAAPDTTDFSSVVEQVRSSQMDEPVNLPDDLSAMDAILHTARNIAERGPAVASTGEREVLSSETNRRKRFALYLTAMPTFGYQRIKSNRADNIMIESIKRIPTFSLDRLGVRLEAGGELPISKRLSAFAGVIYYQRKQTITYVQASLHSTSAHPGPDVQVVIEPTFEDTQNSVEYELKNAGLQVGFAYRLSGIMRNPLTTRESSSSKTIPTSGRKLLHTFGTGVEFHKSLKGSPGGPTGESISDPSLYLFVNAYYRLQYPEAGRLRAILQPTVNYSIYINNNLNAPFYVKPYGLGLNFGCSYHFR